MKIHALAALSPGAPLTPFVYDLAPLAPFEILIKVTHCGLCHSDLHLINNDWGKSIYPLVPGHEVVGVVVQKASQVDNIKIGDRVGVSWVYSSCLSCPTCMEGDTSICPHKTTTCNGHFGGFADHMVADSRFTYLIPEGLDSAHTAPLLCAGATVYAPFRHHQICPSHSVAVIGIGGLGHLALQFAKAFGAEVTAISHSKSKEAEAKLLGADQMISLDHLPKIPQFDFILSTVYADLDWNQIIALLKPKGTLCFVGRVQKSLLIDLSSMISYQKGIVGSSTASRALIREMLLLAARKKILPKIETIPLAKTNEAIERLKKNDVRYRFVLEVS